MPMDIDPSLLAVATPAELALIEQALAAEVALQSPADYAAHCDPTFLRPEHVEILSDTVARLVVGDLRKADGTPYTKLMVSMPPRHGKSELLSKYTPAWFVTKYPDRRAGVASYEADFASSWGRKARDLVEEHPEFGVKISPLSKAAARWDVEGRKGGMFTAGVGGPLMGKGFHLLGIDDPIKNSEEAQSQTVRDSTYDWYRSSALTRMEPGGVVFLVMTRWHDDDLAGRLRREEPDEWFVIDIPAIAGHGDPLGRTPGEALWPERYDEKALAAIRDSVGPYWWSALYQQSPQIEGGGIFRAPNFRYWTSYRVDERLYYRLLTPDGQKDVPESKTWRFSTADMATSKRTTADFTCITTFAVTPDLDVLVVGREKVRVDGSEHEALVRKVLDQQKPRFVGVEHATFGITLVQTLVRKGLKVRSLPVDKDKVSRAYAAGALVDAGRAYFPRNATWLSDWERELLSFPHGAHDDQVDTFSMAAQVLSSREHAPRREREPEPTDLQGRIWAQLKDKRRKKGLHPELGQL